MKVARFARAACMVVVSIAAVAALATAPIPLPERLGGSAPAEATVTGSTYAQAVMADSPAYYWRMGSTTYQSDEEVNTADHTPRWGENGHSVPGASGALLGDSDTAYTMAEGVTTPEPAPIHSKERTLEGWVKVTAAGSGGGLVTHGTCGDTMQIAIGSNGKVTGSAYYPDNPSRPSATSTGAVNDAAWHHLVLVAKQGSMDLYIDGVIEARTAALGGVFDYCGHEWSQYGVGSGFTSVLDEMAAYSRALTPYEIQDHYRASGRQPALSVSEMFGPNGALRNQPYCAQCAGDPVDLSSGNLHMPVPSVSVPGRGPGLNVDVGYNSLAADRKGRFGYGWSSTLDMRLETAPGGNAKTVVQETGATVPFSKSGSVWVAPDRFIATLAASGGDFVFTRNHFEKFTFDGTTGLLKSMSDQFGNTTTLTYSTVSGHTTEATSMTDAGGRSLTIAWSGGYVDTITDPLTSGEGGPRVVDVTVNGSGDMTLFQDLSRGKWTFAYTGHRMDTMTKPRHFGTTKSVTNHYDSVGRVDWQTDELGRKTTIEYDTPSVNYVKVTLPTEVGQASRVNVYKFVDGRREESTIGSGTSDAVTTVSTFDPNTYALETVKVGSNPATVYTDSDDDGNVDYVKDPTNNYSRYTYNAFDEVTDARVGASSATSSDGVVTHSEFHATNGRLEKTTSAYGTADAVETALAYNDAGSHPDDLLTMSITEKGTVVDSRVKTWTYTYAAATGYQTSAQDPEGNTSTTTYNTVGWPLVMTSPKGVATASPTNDYQTTYSYDIANRTRTVTGPEGDITKTVLDANGNTVSNATGITGSKPAGDVTRYTYTDADELATVDPPGTGSKSYTYWPSGERKTYTNELGGVWTTTFDSAGQLGESKDAENNSTVYDYSDSGELTTQRQPVSGATCSGTKVGCVTYGYDNAGRVTSIDYSSSATPDVTSISYDSLGRRIHATVGSTIEDWNWNNLSQLTSHKDVNTKTTSYSWDKVGGLKSITYPGHASNTVNRTFDKAGRLTATTDFAGRSVSFSYDADSNWTGSAFPNTSSGTANTDVYAYDTAGRMTSSTWWDGTTSGTKLGSETYTRDTSTKGMVKSITPTGTAGTTVKNNTYDTRDRLTAATPEAFGYDAASNLTTTGDGALQVFDPAQQLCSSSPSGATGTCTTPAADSTDYTYDSLGNRTTAVDQDNGRRTNTYDQANRLTAVVDDNAGANNPASSLSDTPIVGDFDGNGKADVLSYKAGGTNDDLMWWGAKRADFGRATQNFNVAGTFTPLSGDFNGDGYTDIFWYAPGTNSEYVWFWFGRSGGGYTSYSHTINTTDYTPFVGNFDGDTNSGHSIDDIYWYRAGSGSDWIWFGDTGSDENNHTYAQDNVNVSGDYRPVTGDFDNDGKDDIFWYGPGATADSVWNFTSRTAHTATSKSVSGSDYVVDTGDWDGDGNDDILFNDWTANGGDTIWWGSGLSSSSSKSVSLAVAQFTASGDFNGDGKDDLLVNNYNAGSDTIWWGSTKTDFSTTPVGFASGNSMTAAYTYDADGLRATKTVDGGTAQKFTWGAGGSNPLLLERSSGTSVTSLIYGPGGQPVAQVEPDGTTRWLHNDQLGSVRLTTNATNGDESSRVTFDAYGAVDTQTGTQPLLGYAGQYTDTETGYQYLRARYYDPATGQFLTRDPLMDVTMDAHGYAHENPMAGSDPSGLCGPFGDGACPGSGLIESAEKKAKEVTCAFAHLTSDNAKGCEDEPKSPVKVRAPDYVSGDVAYGGVDVSFAVTNRGHVYVGLGPGTSGASLRGGWFNSMECPPADKVDAFNHGHGTTVGGGDFGLYASETYGYPGSGSEVGVGTPGVGVSDTESWRLPFDLPVSWGGGCSCGQ